MVEYSFYSETYKGVAIDEKDWPVFEARARDRLEHYKRIYTVTVPNTDAESKAICAMADTLLSFEDAQGGSVGAVSSASIGSVSVSYGNVDTSPKAQEKALYNSARTYVDIYRGC